MSKRPPSRVGAWFDKHIEQLVIASRIWLMGLLLFTITIEFTSERDVGLTRLIVAAITLVLLVLATGRWVRVREGSTEPRLPEQFASVLLAGLISGAGLSIIVEHVWASNRTWPGLLIPVLLGVLWLGVAIGRLLLMGRHPSQWETLRLVTVLLLYVAFVWSYVLAVGDVGNLYGPVVWAVALVAGLVGIIPLLFDVLVRFETWAVKVEPKSASREYYPDPL